MLSRLPTVRNSLRRDFICGKVTLKNTAISKLPVHRYQLRSISNRSPLAFNASHTYVPSWNVHNRTCRMGYIDSLRTHTRSYATETGNKTEVPNLTKQEEEHLAARERLNTDFARRLINPPSFQDRVDETKKRLSAWVNSLPTKTANFSKKALQIMWQGFKDFVRNPLVVKDWYTSSRDYVKHGVSHYVSGFKLLMLDMRTAVKLLTRVTRGHSLSRRERMQLLRTSADVFRLIPFAAFVIIPFLELLLPLTLKLFPNMLPSTFEDKLQKEEKLKRELKASIELAKFLQDTLEVMAEGLKKSSNEETQQTAKELTQFIKKLRNGDSATNEDIIKFSKLFSDEITLDHIQRPQLVAMCKYMGIPTFGSDPILRFQLRNKLRQIRSDDRMIHWEGVNSLSMDELQEALRSRGMRATGMSKQRMRSMLQEWMELSLNKSIPSSLLILSRAFAVATDKIISPQEALSNTLGSLPDQVVNEVANQENTEDPNKRISRIMRQNELIEEELQAKQDTANRPDQKQVIVTEEQLQPIEDEKLAHVAEALSTLASVSSLNQEKEELEKLVSDYRNLKVEESASPRKQALTALETKLEKMIVRIQKDIDEAELKIGESLYLIDKDRDGMITVDELNMALKLLKDKNVARDLPEIVRRLDGDQDGKVVVKELNRILDEVKRKQRRQEAEVVESVEK